MAPQSSAKRSSRTWLFGLGGLGVVGGCLCLVVAAIGIFLFNRSRQPSKTEPAVAYILDASGRMSQLADASQTRLAVAQSVMAEVIRPADPKEVSGLRVFGSGAASDACTDTSLVVPFAPANQTNIVAKLPSLTSGPVADASLTEAMIQAMHDLATRTGTSSLVVVTGGADTCHPDAAQLIAQEAARAGIKLETFLVGFMTTAQDAQAIKGMVAQTPNSAYLDAPDAATLEHVLDTVQTHIDQPAASTFAQVVAASQQTAVQGHSACTLDYWPIQSSASWSYNSPGGDWTDSVAEVLGDDSNATTTIVHEIPQSRTNAEWTCTTEGISPANSLEAAFNGNTVQTTVVSVVGVWIPADRFALNASWDFQETYTQTTSSSTSAETFTLARGCSVNAAESVTVPAGTFDTLRADCTEIRTDSAGTATTTELKSWYAKGVGLVKQEQRENGGPSVTSVLSSYFMPNP